VTTPRHAWPLALALVVLASWGACNEPQPVPDPPHVDEEPATKQAPAVAPAVVKPAAPPTPVVVREAGRTIVSAAAPIEDLAALRPGFAWIEDSSVRALLDTDEAPRVLATIVDPHGLASNGERVCWLGDEKNGCHDLARDVAIPLPRVAGPGDQEALAFGDVLYARSRPDALWRFDGDHVARLPFHPDPTWKLLPGLGAGSKVAIVAAIEPRAKQGWFVRVPVRGKVTTIAAPVLPREGKWAVDGRGMLAFVAADDVMIVDPGKTTPRVAVKQADVQQLCWCGADVCTIAGGMVRRHPVGGEPVSLAESLGDVVHLSCGFGRVAWSERTGDAVTRIVAIAAR
jgi:hypothetical protein